MAYWLLSKKMYLANQIQNLDQAVCILLCIDNLGKGMYSSFLPPAMGKIVGQTRLSSLDRATGLGEGKTLNSKPEECLKHL